MSTTTAAPNRPGMGEEGLTGAFSKPGRVSEAGAGEAMRAGITSAGLSLPRDPLKRGFTVLWLTRYE